MIDGRITIDDNACNHCGRCIGKCPFHAVEDYTDGYRIYIGGRWGKKVAQGRYLEKVFTDKDEVLAVVEKAILLFREQGITGERFRRYCGKTRIRERTGTAPFQRAAGEKRRKPESTEALKRRGNVLIFAKRDRANSSLGRSKIQFYYVPNCVLPCP